jgi:hypothetical protein
MRYHRSPDVIATDLASELILLDPASRQMFGLNATGRLVWLNLDGRSAPHLAVLVSGEFEVEAECAAADVAALLGRLHAAGLVREAVVDAP